MTHELNNTPKKKTKIASLERRKARAGWLFILPFLIGFALIYLPIIFESIRFSFNKIVPTQGGYELEFVKFENYSYALTVDTAFVQTLVKGLQQLAFDIPAIIIFSLFMAVMLNQKMAGRGAFRAIFFIPVVLSTGIMATGNTGSSSSAMEGAIDDGSGESAADQLVSSMDLQKLFSSMKVGTEIVDYVAQAINNIYNIVYNSIFKSHDNI